MSPHHLELPLLTTQLLYRFITGRRVPDWAFAIEAAFFIDELLETFHIYDIIWVGTDPRAVNRPDTHRYNGYNHDRRSGYTYTHNGPERRRSAASDVPPRDHYRSRPSEDPRRRRSPTRDEGRRGFATEQYFQRRALSDRGRSERRQAVHSDSGRAENRRVRFEE